MRRMRSPYSGLGRSSKAQHLEVTQPDPFPQLGSGEPPGSLPVRAAPLMRFAPVPLRGHLDRRVRPSNSYRLQNPEQATLQRLLAGHYRHSCERTHAARRQRDQHTVRGVREELGVPPTHDPRWRSVRREEMSGQRRLGRASSRGPDAPATPAQHRSVPADTQPSSRTQGGGSRRSGDEQVHWPAERGEKQRGDASAGRDGNDDSSRRHELHRGTRTIGDDHVQQPVGRVVRGRPELRRRVHGRCRPQPTDLDTGVPAPARRLRRTAHPPGRARFRLP
jgi:hypothetical protein